MQRAAAQKNAAALFGFILSVEALSVKGGAKAICEASFSKPFYRPSCQKATALAAATFSESTPWDMGIFTV